jgi:YbgC/YbaW family acyl-CoA thioester hydrolase
MLKNIGAGFVVRECHVSYKSPAKLDDALNITCKVTELKGVSLKMEQKLYRGDTVLSEIEVTLVFLSLETMRPTKIPAEIISIF